MADTGREEGGAAGGGAAGGGAAQPNQFDPQALLSLYGMSGMYGGYGGYPGLTVSTASSPSSSPLPPSSTLGVAASQAQSLGLNPASAAWWSMASQLATQDYLSRIQAAARDSSPMDYLSRLQGEKTDENLEYLSRLQALQGMGGFGAISHNPRKDPPRSLATPTSAMENIKLPADTEILRGRKGSTDSLYSNPLLSLPTGLTIEKKKPGRKPMESNYHIPSSGEMIDRVEITRIPRNGALDLKSKQTNADDDERGGGGERGGETPLNLSMKSEQSPDKSDYYASEALSGVFLAEQIRQQQLASQLHKHLQPSSLTAMQALLSLGRLQADQSLGGRMEDDEMDGKWRNLGRGNPSVKPKKNTVASLLAHSRGDIPELTIEPIFKKSGSPGFDLNMMFRGDQSTRLSSEKDSEDHYSETESNHQEANGTNGRQRGRQVVTDTDELKVPLRYGWRRETTIREFSKSGIRGEVVYVAPCGKRFKQYPDIIRYIEKRGMSQIKRTHFSFSTKLIVGDFLKPTGTADPEGEEKYQRYTDDQMNEEIDRLRRENGWKPRKRGKSQGRRSVGVEPSAEEQAALLQALKQEDERVRQDKEQTQLQREALRILKEAERREKAEILRREKERSVEEKRRKQEELNRARQEEKMKKLQELELKRQQSALIKEQERERRREHILLIKQLDNKKRNEDRKKKIEELKVEREKERERRMETRRMELEILSEMKRPIEDMAISEAKCLPEIPRLTGLKLSGEGYANLLMVFEFIHNFGETLSFDMESLPSISTLQSGLLNEDIESEEELLSLLTHLVVCAIEDPGVPNPLKQLTILGQNLRQADVTNTNITEILRIFIRSRAQYEIRLFHGVSPPEPKDKKEAIQGPFVNADDSYMALLQENKTFQMSEWIKAKPFLCLNPTEKCAILSFLCNELLNNKAVVNQIENTMENVQSVKRRKISLDNKAKKLRILHNRKYKFKVEVSRFEEGTNQSGSILGESENHSEVGEDKEDSLSCISESKPEAVEVTSKGGRGRGKKRKGGRGGGGEGGGKKKEEEVESEEESELDVSDEDEGKEDEEDGQLNAEDLQKKIEKVSRLIKKKGEELVFLNNSLRASDLGQDRYRRRYWHLAHSGGIYLEGIESGEPWKLEEPSSDPTLSPPPSKKLKLDPELVKTEEENKENQLFCSTPIKEKYNISDLKLGSEVSITPKEAPKNESKYSPKVTPNAERMNLFNHSSYFNMSLSPMILNGSVSITPKENQHSIYGTTHADRNQDKPWFNLISGDGEHEFHPGRSRRGGEALTHIAMLESKLDILKNLNKETERTPIPLEKCYGWWKLPVESSLLTQLEAALHPRGTREQHLLTNLRRGFENVAESTHKLGPEEVEFTAPTSGATPPSSDAPPTNIEEVVPGAPRADIKGTWSRETALRVEKFILEQIESLEDKVASASMQVPGWKIPDRLLADTLKFRPSCEDGDDSDGLNTVEVSKQRLLELEGAIERRYLKAPLGATRTTSLSNITASTERNKQDTTLDLDEKGVDQDNFEEEEDKENKKENNDAVRKDTEENGKDDEEKMEEGETDKKASEGIPRGLQTWREAVSNAENAAQVAMAFYILETSIAWDKSIMKASCQFCHGGENENALLLCDGCDRGYHTYCFKPAITTIPEGDWYCFECVNKATGLRHCLVCGNEDDEGLVLCSACPRAYHQLCISPPLAKTLGQNGILKKTPRGKWHCPGCSVKNGRKTSKKARSLRNTEEEWTAGKEDVKRSEEEPVPEEPQPPEPVKISKKKPVRLPKIDKDMSICQTLLSELGGHDESWPFLNPVNTKQFPTYKKIIKNPMDISTIKKKLNEGLYKVRDEFKDDVQLIFSNCKRYNEDESPVGRAGHLMKLFFDSRWAELTTV